MHSIQNISLIKDIVTLPKDSLVDICKQIGLPTDGTLNDLSSRIWEKIKGDKVVQDEALSVVKSRILSGRTTVTWYKAQDELLGAKNLIISSLDFNPFETVNLPDRSELTNEPVLFAAADGNNHNEYYLRFIYKSGDVRDYYSEVETRPLTKMCTVYMNEEKGIVEIRTDHKAAKEITTVLFRMLRQEKFMEQQRVLAPFGDDVEKLADALNGEVIDTISKPEYLLEEFSVEQAEATVNILAALDEFFGENDLEQLRQNLEQAQEVFGENLLETPFTAIILTGLEKVSMGSHKELRGQPLYDFLRPYLQHQTGFIRFPFREPETGTVEEYTIRVGLKVNSIYFVTPATENVMNYVRERIVI
ncbi:hypothetical protein ABEX69_06730 [Bacillus safensis]|uniref:hypothetical protein n=1 Tax=Bacillus safensis TaxID=561879 RepID=UPI0022813468|nr:hypothetical protein [Bacillus safensis]MCY7563792.1 SAP domain-containing protein [Bacillus safensis]MCY7625498.1 SAP domain-containing protein [Bacillus safensis]MCY7632408.1 SAP domain-containing protein [Bacillus safensis]MCY7652550.1 SAP domain-containing protein [Bacillus safensis]MCY7660566.1 SAP domain-containing protein [Bacillus safensis]